MTARNVVNFRLGYSTHADIVSEIGTHKNSLEKIVDLSREQIILNRLITNSKTKYSKDTIVRIWRELFKASSKLQLIDQQFIQTKRSIDSIKIYKGGKSNIIGKKNIIKLSSNENSHGPSTSVKKFLKSKDISFDLNRYPEIDGVTLRKAIGKFHNIEAERIVLGCGSDENLLLCCDGVIAHLTDEDIHKTIIESPDPDTACQNIVNLANERGGSDNISLIILSPEDNSNAKKIETESSDDEKTKMIG